MSEFICFLITFARIVPYDPEAGQASELIKVALKVHRDDLPRDDAWEYPRECQANLRLLLPPHCRDLGPIVEIEVIAEVAVVEREDPDRWLPYDDHSKLEKRWYDVQIDGQRLVDHFWPNAGQLNHASSPFAVRPGAGFEIRPSKSAPEDLEEKPPGPPSPPRPKPHHEEPNEIVVMHERAPTCYWHAGCACDPWPPMKPIPTPKEHSMYVWLKCTHCNRVAEKSRDQAGVVKCREVLVL